MKRSDLVITTHNPFRLEPMEGKPALYTQDRGCDLLQALDIHHWISSGNLLGLYRDGGLIPHDTDIDVNCRLEWNTDKTIKLLQGLFVEFQSHDFNIIYSTFCLGFPMQLAFIDELTDVIFDIYPFYTGIEPGVAINYNQEGIIKKPLKFITNLKSFTHLGVSYPVPNHLDQFLVWRFGEDWKTPKKSKQPWQEEAPHLIPWSKV